MAQLLCPRCRAAGPFIEGHGAAQCAECSLVFDPEPRKPTALRASRLRSSFLDGSDAAHLRSSQAVSLELARAMRAGCLCVLRRSA